MKKLLLLILIIITNPANTQPPRGLPNYGCACYFNAALQSLFTIHPLTTLLTSNPCNYTNAMIKDYCQLLPALQTNSFSQKHKNFYTTTAAIMGGMGQQDVDEFFDAFLGQIKKEPTLQNFAQRYLNYTLDLSLICPAESFSATPEQLKRIREFKNDEINKHKNIFRLPLKTTLKESFKAFFEQKTSTNPLLKDCTEQFKLSKAPTVLFIAFYRFNDDGSKISTPIQIPLSFKASEYLNSKNPELYELTAALIQQGSSSGGHYTAYVKQDNQWFYCNDSIVTPTNDLSGISNGYAYIYQIKPSPKPPTQEEKKLFSSLNNLKKSLNDLQNKLQSTSKIK